MIGNFRIRKFAGEGDEKRDIVGAITIAGDGTFTRTPTNEQAIRGKLIVRGETLSLDTGTEPFAEFFELDGGYGIEFLNGEFEQWENGEESGDDPSIKIPESLVGDFTIRLFEGESDQQGYPGGTMNIEPDGSYTRSVRDKPLTKGRLSVHGDLLTLHDGSANPPAGEYYQLEDGYGVEDIGMGYEQWERGSQSDQIPETLVGEFHVRRFNSDADEVGFIVGTITIHRDGHFTQALNNAQPVQGQFNVRGETLTLRMNDNRELQAEYYQIDNGYGIEFVNGDEEQWENDDSQLNPSGPVLGELVGEFQIRQYEYDGDNDGYIVGKMSIDREGRYTREIRDQRAERGQLEVFGESMTLNHGSEKIRTKFIPGIDYVSIDRLEAGRELWERIEETSTEIVGDFNIRAFKPNDDVGFIAGTMKIGKNGSYVRTYNGEEFAGQLSTDGELMTLVEAERNVRTRFVRQTRGRVTSYDVDNAGAGYRNVQ